MVEILVGAYLFFQVLGVISSVHAILSTRTPQGAIAWAISLITIPIISVPAYWVLGRSKFDGYVNTWRDIPRDIEQEMETIIQGMLPYAVENSINFPEYEAATRLARSPLLRGNNVQLLVDGRATYDSI
ncbi:MAG: cardiolipin synthase, partial [Gammaproteobacteria bacterium]|nr:cardiolipin synthase [Gammaproteobacteria bacterium]